MLRRSIYNVKPRYLLAAFSDRLSVKLFLYTAVAAAVLAVPAAAQRRTGAVLGPRDGRVHPGTPYREREAGHGRRHVRRPAVAFSPFTRPYPAPEPSVPGPA